MNKIKNILIITGIIALTASCGDDDNIGEEYKQASAVKIISSDLSFNANANSGTVTFESPEGATASVNSSWAKASVDGKTVTVSVSRNPKLEGRSAILTVKCGKDSANVPVHQNGMSFKYGGENSFTYNDGAHTLNLPLVNEGSNLSVEAPEWATASINDNAMTINLSENTSGHVRSGYVYYNAGPYKDSLYIKQGERKDIIDKSYKFGGYDLTQYTGQEDINSILFALNATIIEDDGQLYMYFTDNNWFFPVEFDDENLTLEFRSGQIMGLFYNKYYIISSIIDSGWYQTFSQNGMNAYFSYPADPYFKMLAEIDYNAEYGVMTADLKNAPSNNTLLQGILGDETQTYEADVFGFTAYTTKGASLSGYTNDLIMLLAPFLMQDDTSAAKGMFNSPVVKTDRAAKAMQTINRKSFKK